MLSKIPYYPNNSIPTKIQVTVENALIIFLKAKSCKMEPLALTALNIITQNFDEVKESEEWAKEDGSKLSQMMSETMAFKNSRKESPNLSLLLGGCILLKFKKSFLYFFSSTGATILSNL